MVYRRDGRPGYTFSARTRTGWVEVGTGADSKPLANRIAAMWEELANVHRAWDLLDPILRAGRQRSRKLLALYDAWAETKGDLAEVRRRAQDVDVEQLVAKWEAVHRRTVAEDSAEHALHHVRWLLPEGAPRMASSITVAWLSGRLADYPGKRNTIRKVHSSWSVFFAYVQQVHGCWAADPMLIVPRPPVETSPIRFYELATVEQIVGAQPEPERRAFFALLYGTGIEVTVALGLTMADVDRQAKEIRAAGTKAHARDRVCRVADWAWAILAPHLADRLPTARLWPAHWSRWTVSDWHRETVAALKPAVPAYPLHCARDHWAVRAARAGTPVALIQAQLGHGSPMLTLSKYGRFLPTGADRKRWEEAAGKEDRRRRKA